MAVQAVTRCDSHSGRHAAGEAQTVLSTLPSTTPWFSFRFTCPTDLTQSIAGYSGERAGENGRLEQMLIRHTIVKSDRGEHAAGPEPQDWPLFVPVVA